MSNCTVSLVTVKLLTQGERSYVMYSNTTLDWNS